SASALLVALVMSHWVLDFATHAPDMPLWPGPSPRFGLGLWNSIPLTLAIEGAMWLIGIVFYLRLRPLHGWVSRVAFWSFVILSTFGWAIGPWGAPPPSPTALAWFAMIGWLMIPWA